MQFQIKQVGRALSEETTHEAASNALDKLTVMLFHHTKTSEEAYFVGEMTRGAEPTVAMKVGAYIKSLCIGAKKTSISSSRLVFRASRMS